MFSALRILISVSQSPAVQSKITGSFTATEIRLTPLRLQSIMMCLPACLPVCMSVCQKYLAWPLAVLKPRVAGIIDGCSFCQLLVAVLAPMPSLLSSL